MKALNLYAGVGGNRKLWPESVEVTSVELDEKIANVYTKLYPLDTVVITDAHQYLLDNYYKFDFIWSSPPCQSHSRMMKATRHKSKKYPDLSLYEEIIFLQHFFKGKYVVENVVSYYTPLIPPKKVGRHYYWSNYDVGEYAEPSPDNFINLSNSNGKKLLQNWLGIHYNESLYYNTNRDICQILRNCVHPNEGLSILNNSGLI